MKKQNTKEKKKMSKGAIALIVGIIIILIPCSVFGYILISASLKNHEPVIGNRYDNDLDPAITSDNIAAIQTKVSALDKVEKCTVELTTSQLRVNVDCDNSITDEESQLLVDVVYQTVSKELSVSTYFTSTSTKKMYDLAINVYNEIGSEDFIYYLLTKNSNMTEPSVQLVSVAKNESIASELRGESSDLGETGLQNTGDIKDGE